MDSKKNTFASLGCFASFFLWSILVCVFCFVPVVPRVIKEAGGNGETLVLQDVSQISNYDENPVL